MIGVAFKIIADIKNVGNCVQNIAWYDNKILVTFMRVL